MLNILKKKIKADLRPTTSFVILSLKAVLKAFVETICLKTISIKTKINKMKTGATNLAVLLVLGSPPNLSVNISYDYARKFPNFPDFSNLPNFPSDLPKAPFLFVIIMGTLVASILVISLIDEEDEESIRTVAVIGSVAFFIIWVDGWYFYDPLWPNHLFDLYTVEIPLIPDYEFSLTLRMDGITFCLILLTTFIIPICLLGSGSVYVKFKQFAIYMLIIEIFLVLCFCSRNLLFFYIFFECVLIPMYIIIGAFGDRTRKNKASFYFFLYTLFGSFFLLFGVLYVCVIYGTFDSDVLSYFIVRSDCDKNNKFMFLLFFIPFAVKIPMFPFHLWLPEAHVEAPTTGSVLLASLLLKLGGYGLIRFTLPLFPVACMHMQPFVVVMAIAGVIYGAFSAIRQSDLKRIIAYSSIAHMNLAVLGIFSFTQQGIEGAIYLMVGHGIVSAALFLCVGNISDRHHTRSLKYFSGLVKVMPLFSIFLFIFTLANMSFPGTSNFVGEFLVFVAMYERNIWMAVFAATGIIFSAVYSIWLFNRMNFGTLKTTENESHFADLNRSEFYMFLTLLIPMLLLGVYSGCITSLIDLPVSDIVALYDT